MTERKIAQAPHKGAKTRLPMLDLPERIFCRVNPFPNDKFQNLKLKDFAEDNFKFDNNGRKFSKEVENTVGKEEIAHYEQIAHYEKFLL